MGGGVMIKNHSHDRKSRVPLLVSTTVKTCKQCDLWFAARPRETVCDACVRPSVRAKRASLGDYPGTASRLSKSPGRSGVAGRVRRAYPAGWKVIYSEPLKLTFACGPRDKRYASLECRVLAYELAMKVR